MLSGLLGDIFYICGTEYLICTKKDLSLFFSLGGCCSKHVLSFCLTPRSVGGGYLNYIFFFFGRTLAGAWGQICVQRLFYFVIWCLGHQGECAEGKTLILSWEYFIYNKAVCVSFFIFVCYYSGAVLLLHEL